ncbi:MAG: DUF4307 domain-containing protein [Nocardioidaceae bacterium]
MTHPADADADADVDEALAARYGRRPAGGVPTGKILAGLVVAALLAWALWAAAGQQRASVDAVVRSYRVQSEHLVSVTVDITRSTSKEAQCTVSALATDHTAVGERVVRLPAGNSGTQSVTVPVRTEREANSADVDDCR